MLQKLFENLCWFHFVPEHFRNTPYCSSLLLQIFGTSLIVSFSLILREPSQFEKAPPPIKQLSISWASSNQDEIFFWFISIHTAIERHREHSATLPGADAIRKDTPDIFYDGYCRVYFAVRYSPYCMPDGILYVVLNNSELD